MLKPIKTETAEGMIASFLEDLIVPFRAQKGIDKYTKKGKKFFENIFLKYFL